MGPFYTGTVMSSAIYEPGLCEAHVHTFDCQSFSQTIKTIDFGRMGLNI